MGRKGKIKTNKNLKLLYSGNRGTTKESVDDVAGAKVVEEPLSKENILEEDMGDGQVSVAQHQVGGRGRRGG